MILTLKTDSPQAEIGLFDGTEKVNLKSWQAHRQLAETLHSAIDEVLSGANKLPSDITGIVIFEGPGSFTGLRIGMSVANALAYSLKVPIIASSGGNWLQIGLTKITQSHIGSYAKPAYGATANITSPKK